MFVLKLGFFLKAACRHDSMSLERSGLVGVLAGVLMGRNISTVMKDINAAGHQKLYNGTFTSCSGMTCDAHAIRFYADLTDILCM